MKLLTKEQWLRRKKRKKHLLLFLSFSLLILIISFTVLILSKANRNITSIILDNEPTLDTLDGGLEIKKSYLTPNPYSRPQSPLLKVTSIVVHYTGNPGTTAKSNRNYFENLRLKKTTSASSHFVIGLEGEIIQCIPLNEISYASNDRNNDTISIENCHPDDTGEFTKETNKSLVALVATLCYTYNLDKDDIIRHYDVTGKKCPLYYVDHEDEWEIFKNDVMKYISDNVN
jgi:N-acetylmuramoyl-L-alanine amidase CwlA